MIYNLYKQFSNKIDTLLSLELQMEHLMLLNTDIQKQLIKQKDGLSP